MAEQRFCKPWVGGSIPLASLFLVLREELKGAPTQFKGAATSRSSDIPLEARVADPERVEDERMAPIPRAI